MYFPHTQSNKLGQIYICSIGYQNSNFRMGLSMFSCAEKYNELSTHCAIYPILYNLYIDFPGTPTIKIGCLCCGTTWNFISCLILLRLNVSFLWYLHCWWRISQESQKTLTNMFLCSSKMVRTEKLSKHVGGPHNSQNQLVRCSALH